MQTSVSRQLAVRDCNRYRQKHRQPGGYVEDLRSLPLAPRTAPTAKEVHCSTEVSRPKKSWTHNTTCESPCPTSRAMRSSTQSRAERPVSSLSACLISRSDPR